MKVLVMKGMTVPSQKRNFDLTPSLTWHKVTYITPTQQHEKTILLLEVFKFLILYFLLDLLFFRSSSKGDINRCEVEVNMMDFVPSFLKGSKVLLYEAFINYL